MRITRFIVLIGLMLVAVVLAWQKSTPHYGRITASVPHRPAVGQSVTIPIYIDTGSDTINAAEVYLTFDPSVIAVDSVAKDPSFFQLWITDQPAYSNETGTLSFAGGLPSPGFKGRGQVGSVTLHFLKHQAASLTFESKTRILKNDGQGTAVPLIVRPIIIAPS